MALTYALKVQMSLLKHQPYLLVVQNVVKVCNNIVNHLSGQKLCVQSRNTLNTPFLSKPNNCKTFKIMLVSLRRVQLHQLITTLGKILPINKIKHRFSKFNSKMYLAGKIC